MEIYIFTCSLLTLSNCFFLIETTQNEKKSLKTVEKSLGIKGQLECIRTN